MVFTSQHDVQDTRKISKTIVNHPYVDGLYLPFLVILGMVGMVDYFFTNITCLSRREASQEHNVTTAEFKVFHVFPDRLQLKPHAVATCEKKMKARCLRRLWEHHTDATHL